MDIICNSSPIIGLSAINRLNLLWLLFDKVIIPNEVYLEVDFALKGMWSLKSDVEKAKYVHDYLTNTITYQMNSPITKIFTARWYWEKVYVLGMHMRFNI